MRWERLRKQNRWLDALYNASVAAHACGVRLVEEQHPDAPPPEEPARRARVPHWMQRDETPRLGGEELVRRWRERRW